MTRTTGPEKMTVLVVDDAPEVRSLISKVLKLFGCPCEEAADGVEALNRIRRRPFDMVICDIRMPEMDGLKVMAEARKIWPDMPFVIITGYGGDYSYDEMVEAGALDFILKPFTHIELKSRLGRILKERRLARENMRLWQEEVNLNRTLSTVLSVARDLTSELQFNRLIPLIVGKITRALRAERSSLYLIDRDRGEVWTKVAEKVREIRVPLGQGISGRVAATGEIINVPDAWELPYFDRTFDLKHHFRTRSVLCVPISSRSGDRIGVIQVINKIGGGEFDKEDARLLMSLASAAGIAIENSFLVKELEASFEGAMRTLAATVDARHPLTAGHSQRVTEYAVLIAKEMNLSEDDQVVVKYAGLLHDIGKIGIKDQILFKDGSLTPQERAEMDGHPVKTRAILEKFHFPKHLDQVPIVAAYHHEKMDGRGYPYGLAAGSLPLGSRILAVADVFDALTSPRDYPKYSDGEVMGVEGMSPRKVIQILKSGSGTHFDPRVVDAFFRCLPAALTDNLENHFTREYAEEMLMALEAVSDCPKGG